VGQFSNRTRRIGSLCSLAVWLALTGCKGDPEPSASVNLPLSPGAASAAAGPLDIPELKSELVADLDKTSVLVDVDSPLPALSHRLMAPKGWSAQRIDSEGTGRPFEARTASVIVRDASPDAPSVTVAVREAPFEVPVDGLLRHVFAGEGWAVERASWVPGEAGLHFDVTGVKAKDGVPWVRRTTARAAGGRIFEVDSLSKRSDWDANKTPFLIAGATFELHEGADQTRLEPWQRVEAKSPGFELAYPKSWQAEAAPSSAKNVSAVNLRLLGAKDEVLLGYLQVRVERAPDKTSSPIGDRLAKAVEKLEHQNVVLEGQPRRLTEDEDPRAIVVNGWLGTFVAPAKMPDGSAADVRFGFLERHPIRLQVVKISPTLADDPIAALRAQRAFEIARQTFDVLGG
jgi:hypothetical protein